MDGWKKKKNQLFHFRNFRSFVGALLSCSFTELLSYFQINFSSNPINQIKKLAECLVSGKICFYEKIPFVCGVFLLKYLQSVQFLAKFVFMKKFHLFVEFFTKILVAIVTFRGRFRIPAISKTQFLVTIVNGFHLLTITASARVTSQMQPRSQIRF